MHDNRQEKPKSNLVTAILKMVYFTHDFWIYLFFSDATICISLSICTSLSVCWLFLFCFHLINFTSSSSNFYCKQWYKLHILLLCKWYCNFLLSLNFNFYSQNRSNSKLSMCSVPNNLLHMYRILFSLIL